MKPEKVGQNRTYRKKALKCKPEKTEATNNWKLPRSTVTRPPGSAGNMCTSKHEQASNYYNTTEDEDKVVEDNTGQTFDISTLAEICVLDELENSKSVEITNMKQESISNVFYTLPEPNSDSPFTTLMNPVLDLTLEEEFRIHEFDAIKESLLDGCFKTLNRVIPHFQQICSSMLISLSQGLCPSVSSEAVLTRQKNISTVIWSDLFDGGKICKLLNCYSSFQNVPDKVKMETLKFSLSVTDLCTK